MADRLRRRPLHCAQGEKNEAVRERNNTALRATAADPAAHRAYLLRASLIDSVRKAKT
jgi:hypothetical protein